MPTQLQQSVPNQRLVDSMPEAVSPMQSADLAKSTVSVQTFWPNVLVMAVVCRHNCRLQGKLYYGRTWRS